MALVTFASMVLPAKSFKGCRILGHVTHSSSPDGVCDEAENDFAIAAQSARTVFSFVMDDGPFI